MTGGGAGLSDHLCERAIGNSGSSPVGRWRRVWLGRSDRIRRQDPGSNRRDRGIGMEVPNRWQERQNTPRHRSQDEHLHPCLSGSGSPWIGRSPSIVVAKSASSKVFVTV